MKKLGFLIGKWSGEARLLRGSGEAVELVQTEEAQYKLNGLILTIEGVGRTKAEGEAAGVRHRLIHDEAGAYRMQAYNDGRYLETELKLADDGKGAVWGFSVGEVKTHSLLRINEKGEWTELAEIMVGSSPPRKLMELTVSPEKEIPFLTHN